MNRIEFIWCNFKQTFFQRRVAVLPYSIDWKSIKVDNGQIFPVVSGDERKKLLWYYLKLEGDASLSPQFELRWNHSDITSLSEYVSLHCFIFVCFLVFSFFVKFHSVFFIWFYIFPAHKSIFIVYHKKLPATLLRW